MNHLAVSEMSADRGMQRCMPEASSCQLQSGLRCKMHRGAKCRLDMGWRWQMHIGMQFPHKYDAGMQHLNPMHTTL